MCQVKVPLKTSSLPRLELKAPLLLSQLCESGKTALSGTIQNIYLWSDSIIVLEIKTKPSPQKSFVANRVAKIQELTEAMWSHVPFYENLANVL